MLLQPIFPTVLTRPRLPPPTATAPRFLSGSQGGTRAPGPAGAHGRGGGRGQGGGGGGGGVHSGRASVPRRGVRGGAGGRGAGADSDAGGGQPDLEARARALAVPLAGRAARGERECSESARRGAAACGGGREEGAG
eukprot:614019-Rhodomonas_salina.1